jgi:hypothetical protein
MVNPKLKSRAPPPREGAPTVPRFAAEEETSQKGPRLSPAGGGKAGPGNGTEAFASRLVRSRGGWARRLPVGRRPCRSGQTASWRPRPDRPSTGKAQSQILQQQSISQAITNCYDWWGAVPSIGHSRYGGPCGVLDPGRPAQSPRRPCPGLRGIFPNSVEARKKKAPRLSPAGPLADVVLLADLCSRRGSTMAGNG